MLLVCSGLDHAHRGYESFARECFETLRDEPALAIELVKGSGSSGPAERVVPTLRRDRRLARALGRAMAARPFRFEAFAFGFSLQPLLRRRSPDVVYLSEWDTARVLATLRSLTGQRFRLLYCNGGFASEGFEHLDHVQELTPAGLDWVLARGADPRKHTVLPMGLRIRQLPVHTESQRLDRRARLGLPTDRTIVVSVAALNCHHKRLDYLIEELAALPEPRPFLLLDGQVEEETPRVHSVAQALLGEGQYEIRTSPSAQVSEVLRASDFFVLASLAETQARALLEAAAQGVPCMAHDSPVTRYALGEHGLFGDFSRRGSLTHLLGQHMASAPEALRSRTEAAYSHVADRFDWDRLRPRYVELLQGVANNTVSSSSGEKLSRNS